MMQQDQTDKAVPVIISKEEQEVLLKQIDKGLARSLRNKILLLIIILSGSKIMVQEYLENVFFISFFSFVFVLIALITFFSLVHCDRKLKVMQKKLLTCHIQNEIEAADNLNADNTNT